MRDILVIMLYYLVTAALSLSVHCPISALPQAVVSLD